MLRQASRDAFRSVLARAEPARAFVRRHPRATLYAVSLLIHLLIAPFLVHDWDGYVFITTARDFLHGQSPYATVESEPSYIYIGDGVPIVNSWYAYPPVALLLMTPFYGLMTLMFGAVPWAERVGIKIPFILGDLALAFVAAELVRLVIARRDPVLAQTRARLVERLILLNPFLIIISAAWGMFDALMIMFLLAALLFIERERPVWSGAAMALAILVKPFPVFVAPLFLGYIFVTRGPKIVGRWIAGGTAVALLVCVPFLLTSPQGFLQQVVYNHAGRPPQGFTLAGIPLAFGWINGLIGTNLPSDITPEAISSVAFVVLATFMALFWAQAPRMRTPERLVHLSLATLVGMLIISKVVNEQYFVMPVALAAVAFALSGDRVSHWIFRLYSVGGIISVFFLGYHFATFIPPDVAPYILPGDPLDFVPSLTNRLGWDGEQSYVYPTLIAAGSLVPALLYSFRLIGPELIAPLKALRRKGAPQSGPASPTVAAVLLVALLLLPVSAGLLAARVDEKPVPVVPSMEGPLVGAYYYLWWHNPAHDPRIEYGNWQRGTTDVPAEGYYTTTAGKLQSDFRAMKKNGIDLVLFSYQDFTKPKMPALHRLASANGLLAAPVIELGGLTDDPGNRPRDANGTALPIEAGYSLRNETQDRMVDLIADPLTDFHHLPSWWRMDERPVVIVHDASTTWYDADDGQVRARMTAAALDLLDKDHARNRSVDVTAEILLASFPENRENFSGESAPATIWRRAFSDLQVAFWDGVRERLEARVGPVFLIGDVSWKPDQGARNGAAIALADLASLNATYMHSPSDLLLYDLSGPFEEAHENWRDAQTLEAQNHRRAGKPVIASVTPGHDDRARRGDAGFVVPYANEGVTTYELLWDDAIALHPDFVFVDSWNEFHIGSEIEPGMANGDSRLGVTRVYSERLRAAEPQTGSKVLIVTNIRGSSFHVGSGDPDASYRYSINLARSAERQGWRVESVDWNGPGLPLVDFDAYELIIVEPGARFPWSFQADELVPRLGATMANGTTVLVLGSDVGRELAKLANWTEPESISGPLVLLAPDGDIPLPAANQSRRHDVPAEARVYLSMRDDTRRLPAAWTIEVGNGTLAVTAFRPQGEGIHLAPMDSALRAVVEPLLIALNRAGGDIS